jgi:hypothetical protein
MNLVFSFYDTYVNMLQSQLLCFQYHVLDFVPMTMVRLLTKLFVQFMISMMYIFLPPANG